MRTDRYNVLMPLTFPDFVFETNSYTEYRNGKLVRQDNVNTCITYNNIDSGRIKVLLSGISPCMEIKKECEFDALMTMGDRLMLTILPEHTNITNPLLSLLENLMPYTRECKIFANDEPIAGNIFTSDGNIVKISFLLPDDHFMEFLCEK